MKSEKLTALFVDPQPESLEALRFQLNRLDIQVVATRSGAEAIAEIEKNKFAVVLMECNLPDMTGIKLLTKIKEQVDIPCMFYTSAEGDDYGVAADLAGASAFLFKSVPLGNVVTMIRITLHRESEKSHTVSRALKSRDEMERQIRDRRQKDSLIGAMSHAWGLDRDETYSLLVQFSRNHGIRIEKLAELQSDYQVELSSLNRQFGQRLADITPEALQQLRDFYLKETGRPIDQIRYPASIYQGDFFNLASK